MTSGENINFALIQLVMYTQRSKLLPMIPNLGENFLIERGLEYMVLSTIILHEYTRHFL